MKISVTRTFTFTVDATKWAREYGIAVEDAGRDLEDYADERPLAVLRADLASVLNAGGSIEMRMDR